MTKSLPFEDRSNAAAKPSIHKNRQRRPEDEAKLVVVKPNAPLPSPASQPVYEVCNDGPLTYFHFYFDEDERLTPQHTPSESPPTGFKSFTKIVIGTGALTATVATGLMIADALHKPEPKAEKPADSSVKQGLMPNSARPTAAAPEKMEMPRSQPSSLALPQKPLSTPPSPRSKAGSTHSAIATLPPQAKPLPPIASIATPAIATSQPRLPDLSPSLPSIPPAQSASSSATLTQKPRQQISPLQAANLSPVAPPETLPLNSQATSQPIEASQVTAFPPNSADTPLSVIPTPSAVSSDLPSKISSGQSTLPVASPEAIAPSPSTAPRVFRQPPTALTEQPLTSPTASSPEWATGQATATGQSMPAALQALRATTSPSTLQSPETNSSTNPTRATPPQGLQAYLVLAQKPVDTRKVSLMPLSEQAAAEASETRQVGTFRVVQTDNPTYQKEWLASNQNSPDPAIALAFPAYGFIDYQRQVIVVLQNRPDQPVQQSRVPIESKLSTGG